MPKKRYIFRFSGFKIERLRRLVYLNEELFEYAHGTATLMVDKIAWQRFSVCLLDKIAATMVFGTPRLLSNMYPELCIHLEQSAVARENPV